MRCRQPRLAQPGIEVRLTAVTQAQDHHTGKATLTQTQFGIEDLAVEALDRRGIQPMRRCTQQGSSQRQVGLLFHPVLHILLVEAVQVDVVPAALVLPGARLLITETAIGSLLIEHGVQVFFSHFGTGAEHDHMRGIEKLLGVVGITLSSALGQAGLAFGRVGDDEMPGLGIDRRRAVTQLFEQGVDGAWGMRREAS